MPALKFRRRLQPKRCNSSTVPSSFNKSVVPWLLFFLYNNIATGAFSGLNRSLKNEGQWKGRMSLTPEIQTHYPSPTNIGAQRPFLRRKTLFVVSDPSHDLSLGRENKQKLPRRTNFEPAIGAILAVTIILVLALSSQQDSMIVVGQLTSDSPLENTLKPLNEIAMAAATNIFESYVPTTSTDLVAVALGESIGGIVGVTFSVAINLVLQANRNQAMAKNGADRPDDDFSVSRRTTFLSQALSDSDFFIANGASLSLLQAVGMNPRVAQISSVLIASVPSQLVKLGPVLRERRSQEEQLLHQLLCEEEERKRNHLKSIFFSWSRILPTGSALSSSQKGLLNSNAAEMVPVLGEVVAIDFVEVFADVTRWLEYDALKSEYFGTLQWNGENLDVFSTGAILGLVAGVSARLYADILYGWFQFGSPTRQNEVQKRTNPEWFSLYFLTAASASALFGFYELSQRPISRWIQGILAGGADGCIGSSSFDVCLQTYIDENSPGPSTEAQFRALITNLYMVMQRLQDVSVDTSARDVSALVGAWSVAFSSFLHHIFAPTSPMITTVPGAFQ